MCAGIGSSYGGMEIMLPLAMLLAFSLLVSASLAVLLYKWKATASNLKKSWLCVAAKNHRESYAIEMKENAVYEDVNKCNNTDIIPPPLPPRQYMEETEEKNYN